MPLNFEAKSEHDLVELLEASDGDFEVIESCEKTSKKSGSPMIELKIRIWDVNGKEANIFDYLMLNDSKYSLRKIRHFCYSVGLESNYEEGRLHAEDCVGKMGKLKIGVQEAQNGYPPKNNVIDYLVEKQKSEESEVSKQKKPEKFDYDVVW